MGASHAQALVRPCLSYDDTTFHAGNREDWDYEHRTWRAGAGGHYLVGKRTMMAPAFAVFRRLVGTGTILEVDLRHAVTDWLELTAGARRITSPDRDVARRAFEAMLTMRKIDVAKIESAIRG